MGLSPGTRLGAYEIVGLLGAGGMGEVYRARDTRLDRQVAIKALPDDFRADAERTARLEREAKLLASFNHAHVASIYGLERRPTECLFQQTPALPHGLRVEKRSSPRKIAHSLCVGGVACFRREPDLDSYVAGGCHA